MASIPLNIIINLLISACSVVGFVYACFSVLKFIKHLCMTNNVDRIKEGGFAFAYSVAAILFSIGVVEALSNVYYSVYTIQGS